MSTTQPARLRLLLAASLLCSVIGCDQVTKNVATKHLKDAPAHSYLQDTIRLDYALNPGGFLSLGQSLSPGLRQSIFVGFNACLLLAVGLVLIFHRGMSSLSFVCLLLILAGGIGNLIDRVVNQGLVTDFINIGLGPFRTGIFNVADIAVSLGACLALYLTIRGEANSRPEQTSASSV